MPILELQRRYVEKGRIRLGEQRTSANGRTYPAALATLRFTSPDRVAIESVAAVYGGTVEPWNSPAGPQWAVTTERADVPVLIPSLSNLSAWFEEWDAGGLRHRCDGLEDFATGGPCSCDPEARVCQPTTRLNVLLPEVVGIGTWRVEAHGWNAAVELPPAVELLRAFSSEDRAIPARLRIDQRTVKRIGEDGRPVTRRFVVPVLDIDVSVGELLGNRPLERPETPAIEAPRGKGAGDSPGPDLDETGSPAIGPDHRPQPPSLDEQLAGADELRASRTRVPLTRPGLPLRPASMAPDRLPASAPRRRESESTGRGVDPGAPQPPADPSLPVGDQPPPPDEEDAGGLGPSHRRLMAVAREAFPDVTREDREALRYAVTAVITGGDRVSSKLLTATERDRVTELLRRVVEGTVSVSTTGLAHWVVDSGRRVADVALIGDTYAVKVKDRAK